jgi:hypothetical protein
MKINLAAKLGYLNIEKRGDCLSLFSADKNFLVANEI